MNYLKYKLSRYSPEAMREKNIRSSMYGKHPEADIKKAINRKHGKKR